MKNTNRSFLFIIGILVVLIIGVFALRSPKETSSTKNDTEIVSSDPVVFPAFATTTSPLVASDPLVKEALSVFRKYLTSAEQYNLEGITATSHSLSVTCKDPQQMEKCRALMDTAYFFGRDVEVNALTNKWSDNKQLILSSDFVVNKEISTSTIAYLRNIIYFSLTDNKNPKVVYFSPADGSAFKRGVYTEEEIIDKLKTSVIDRDRDGLADDVENCKNTSPQESCRKTNPLEKDTDKDGWWDGTQRFLYH